MLDSLRCPHCRSEQIAEYSVYETKHNGSRKLYQCIECHQVFSETKGTFFRKHFTTQKVPAVVLGILKEGLSWGQMMRIQRLPIFNI